MLSRIHLNPWGHWAPQKTWRVEPIHDPAHEHVCRFCRVWFSCTGGLMALWVAVLCLAYFGG